VRQQFVEGEGSDADYSESHERNTDEHEGSYGRVPEIVRHDAPWATIAIRVDGGYMAFESNEDYETWKNHQ